MQQCEAVLAAWHWQPQLGLGKKVYPRCRPETLVLTAEGVFFCHSLGGGQSSYH